MNDFIFGCRMEGEVIVDGLNLSSNNIDVESLRKNVGMVFKSLILFQNQFLIMLLTA